nr:MAG TPA: hypothetical protein [Caudoviricetes sp.]
MSKLTVVPAVLKGYKIKRGIQEKIINSMVRINYLLKVIAIS